MNPLTTKIAKKFAGFADFMKFSLCGLCIEYSAVAKINRTQLHEKKKFGEIKIKNTFFVD